MRHLSPKRQHTFERTSSEEELSSVEEEYLAYRIPQVESTLVVVLVVFDTLFLNNIKMQRVYVFQYSSWIQIILN